MKKKIYVLSFVFFLVDLISKIFVLGIKSDFPITVIDNFFVINRVMNEGGAFSLFSGFKIVLIILALVVLYYINKRVLNDVKTNLGVVGVSMLVGGIIGNLFDRVIYGKVIDFLSFNIFGYMFPIFNVADIFICVGICLLIIDYIRGERNEDKSFRGR